MPASTARRPASRSRPSPRSCRTPDATLVEYVARRRSGAGGARGADHPRPKAHGSAMLHAEYDRLGGYAARSRAAQLAAGLGFAPDDLERSGAPILRRPADAGQPRTRADAPLRRAAARRADQPSRSRCGAVAGGLAAELRRDAAAGVSRPRVPRWRGRPHTAHRGRASAQLCRQLQRLRDAARARKRSARRRCWPSQARERARVESFVSALSRPGQQGAPGAEPHEVAGPPARHRAAASRGGLRVGIRGAREAAAAPADTGARRGRLRRSPRVERCVARVSAPATASEFSAATAPANRR